MPNSSGVEAILTIDGRGEIVIPKKMRKKANLNDGDKMALISFGDGKGICCLMLVPTDTFSKDMSHFIHKILSGEEETKNSFTDQRSSNLKNY